MCYTLYFGDKLIKAVKEGKVSEDRINDAAIRIVRTLLAFTEADDKEHSKDVISCKEHIE